MKSSHRLFSIDLAKFIAAILVIGIHTRPFCEISKICDFYFVEIICRLAVPFFAVCTGYYLTDQMSYSDGLALNTYNKKILLRTFKKILLIYISWSLFYLCFHLYDWYNSGILSVYYLIGWCKSFIYSTSYYHLWYFVALFYGLIWYYLILYYVKIKYIPAIIIVLWGLEILGYCYSTFIPQLSKSILYLYSFGSISTSITRMLPLLLMGAVIAKQKKHPSLNTSLFLFIISFIFLSIEALWLCSNGITRFSYIIFTLPSAYFLFISILSMKTYYSDKSWLFAKMSVIIYCIHPAIIYCIKDVFSPHITFIVTIIIATIISYHYVILKKYVITKTRE